MPSAPLFVHLAYQCSFLFVYFVGLYAGHPYIHLISFEIFLLAFLNTVAEYQESIKDTTQRIAQPVHDRQLHSDQDYSQELQQFCKYYVKQDFLLL